MNKLNREIYRENPTRYIEEWRRMRARTKNRRAWTFWGNVCYGVAGFGLLIAGILAAGALHGLAGLCK